MTGRKEFAVGYAPAGKTALITEAARRISRAVALGLADAAALGYPPERVKTERSSETGER